MSRITRAASYRRKNALKMSKGETALEAAFKEKDVVTVSTSSTLTSIPDLIIVPDGHAGITIDIVVPASAPQEFARVVKVANLDTDSTVTVSVKGQAALAQAQATCVEYYIADASSATAPTKLS